jgi:hypothetical protein
MRFSEFFHIKRDEDDDWFDPNLTVDTKLFIDPLLLLAEGGEWTEGHKELIAHFVHCYELIAKASSKTSLSAQAALRLLTFPEPSEIGLGYTAFGTRGSGSGGKYAATMSDGIAVAIAAGLKVPEHIEEIGILNEGIGADRISDAVANVLKARFISYTQQIAQKYAIPVEPHKIRNAAVSLEDARWFDKAVDLPTNPETKQAILLVPSTILNTLPTLNADDWFYSDVNSDIRLSTNINLGKAAKKADIVRWARQHPDRVREWAKQQTSRQDLSGYDFEADPIGVIQWDRVTAKYAAENPLQPRNVNTQDDLVSLIRQVIQQFRHFIEDQRGWKLLWNDDGSEKPEEAAQLLFLGMSQQYLRQFNVEIDREVELGRGPVDFKASTGSSIRLLIEVKKLHNGKFWNGLRYQLPSYLQSDDTDFGWFIPIQYRDNENAKEKIRELPKEVEQVSKDIGKRLEYTFIDGRRPSSASKIVQP